MVSSVAGPNKEGEEMSTHTTNFAVSSRVQPTDAHWKRLALDVQGQPTSEGFVKKILNRLAQD